MSEVSGMYKIAVLGERESVMGFAALGLTVFLLFRHGNFRGRFL